jgi:hypothetical protein
MKNRAWQQLLAWLDHIFIPSRNIPNGRNSVVASRVKFCILFGLSEVYGLGIPWNWRRHLNASESVDFIGSWESGIKVADDTIGRHENVQVSFGDVDAMQ